MPKPIQPSSPFANQQSKGVRFSIASLLLIMLVFSGMSAAMCFALAVPKVSAEVHAWIGWSEPSNRDGTDRSLQFAFVIFSFSAPLLMAGTIGAMAYTIRRAKDWQQSRRGADEDGLPWDELAVKQPKV